MGIFDIFSNSKAQEAAQAKIQGLKNAQSEAYSQVDQGVDAAQPYYAQAYQPFEALIGQNQKGADAYADATGVNGTEGTQRALDAFRSTPGVQFSIDQGTKAGLRAASAGGMIASGNTLTALQDRAQNTADTKYGDYVSRLAPYLSGSLSAAQGGATVLTGQGQLENQAGQSKAQYGYSSNAGQGQAQYDADMAAYGSSANSLNFLLNAAKLGLGSGVKFA